MPRAAYLIDGAARGFAPITCEYCKALIRHDNFWLEGIATGHNSGPSWTRRLFVESMMPSHHIGWSMGIHSSVIYMGTFLALFDQSSHDYNYLL
jgi:hypothetical protein